MSRGILTGARSAIVAELVKLVFSILFLAPATFILVTYPSQIAELRKDANEFDIAKNKFRKTLEEVKAMGDVAKTGWFSRDQRGKELVDIVDRVLSYDLRASRLDVRFVMDSIRWFDEAEIQLVQERGKIRGYTFHDETHKSFQTQLVAKYEARIGSIKHMAELIAGWHKYSYDERRGRLEKVVKGAQEALEAIRALYSVLDQQIAGVEEKAEEMRRRAEYLRGQLKKLETWKGRAYGGMLFGVILLMWFIWPYRSKIVTRLRRIVSA